MTAKNPLLNVSKGFLFDLLFGQLFPFLANRREIVEMVKLITK